MKLTFGIYWGKDKWALLLDLVSSIALVFVANEWIDSAYIMGKIKTAFLLVGIGGSYVVMQLASRAKQPFREKTDKATNIMDFGSEEKPKP